MLHQSLAGTLQRQWLCHTLQYVQEGWSANEILMYFTDASQSLAEVL